MSHDPTVRLYRRRPVVILVLVALLALCVGIIVAQSIRAGQRADRNSGAASTAIDAAEQLCKQVRAYGGACAVNPGDLARPEKGDAGAPGQRGEVGPRGPAGPAPACLLQVGQCRGPIGPRGLVGPAPPCLSEPGHCRGEPGTNGVDGKNGTDGANGRDGVDGTDGANGADGAPGPACPVGYHLEPLLLNDAGDYLICHADPAPSPSPSSQASLR